MIRISTPFEKHLISAGELVIQMPLKLAVSDLLRCKSVCKSCFSLINIPPSLINIYIFSSNTWSFGNLPGSNLISLGGFWVPVMIVIVPNMDLGLIPKIMIT
ncbi:hypothetical protein FEM48_Zijuj07G0144300 [Ziziphus jujuba var. spinosa]|uniref:Uncharacterized protein n=1 Tax=Ziziphus jujuba var. spinosa TaxID=714518 RepID=A0A978V559_ZIZJJ|nr:hypothetical protein FEM48_Zijuj07G0144300 [Ziziphus jujuba var. spinosa]